MTIRLDLRRFKSGHSASDRSELTFPRCLLVTLWSTCLRHYGKTRYSTRSDRLVWLKEITPKGHEVIFSTRRVWFRWKRSDSVRQRDMHKSCDQQEKFSPIRRHEAMQAQQDEYI